MVRHRPVVWTIWVAVVVTLLGAAPLRAASAESDRLTRAKDLIGDEQWLAAIQELKAAVADPRERNRDEALFWLAQCESEARDTATAVSTIQQLERDFPHSRWVKPARSLWSNSRSGCVATTCCGTRRRPRRRRPRRRSERGPPAPGARPGTLAAPPRRAAPTRPPAHRRVAAAAAGLDAGKGITSRTWICASRRLASLMHTDAPQVIPMLRRLRSSGEQPRRSAARGVRAGAVEPHGCASTVLEVAQDGAGTRARCRRAGARAVLAGRRSPRLLQVYSTANAPGEVSGRDVARRARRSRGTDAHRAVGDRSAASRRAPSSRSGRRVDASSCSMLYTEPRPPTRSGRSSSVCSTRTPRTS